MSSADRLSNDIGDPLGTMMLSSIIVWLVDFSTLP
jgi:hypothetical protein